MNGDVFVEVEVNLLEGHHHVEQKMTTIFSIQLLSKQTSCFGMKTDGFLNFDETASMISLLLTAAQTSSWKSLLLLPFLFASALTPIYDIHVQCKFE